MYEKLKTYTEQAVFSCSSTHDLSRRLLRSRKIYEEFTGKIDEDLPEYELKMLSFNDWFLFDFIDSDRKDPFIIEFIDSLEEPKELAEEIKSICRNVMHSLFECRKKMFGSNATLENFLTRKKYSVPLCELPFHLHSSEIFTGRMACIGKRVLIFKGVQWLPGEVRPFLLRKAKKIRQEGDPEKMRRFVLRLETASARCVQFKHVTPLSIFESLI